MRVLGMPMRDAIRLVLYLINPLVTDLFAENHLKIRRAYETISSGTIAERAYPHRRKNTYHHFSFDIAFLDASKGVIALTLSEGSRVYVGGEPAETRFHSGIECSLGTV